MTLLFNSPNVPTIEPIIRRGSLTVDVVRSLDEYAAIVAIRAQVFQAEQDCPYAEEFDGNDLSGATHLLARSNGEPIGTMRLRWFADFVKAERYAVVAQSRNMKGALALIDAACILAGRKGYDKILGHAQIRYAPFWTRKGGGYIREDRPRFSFSNHEYLEVIREVTPPNNRLDIDSDPLILSRPEGSWDQEGILDISALR